MVFLHLEIGDFGGEGAHVVHVKGTESSETLCRYYRALSLVETRFPISKDSGDVNVSFTWYDAFRASKRTEQHSVHFEKAAILFNIGAVVTQQALAADRTTDAGLKEASRKFQVCNTLCNAPIDCCL